MSAPAWSPQQRVIFRWFAEGDGNLVVRARAGTGKTTTIIEAIRHARERTNMLLAAFNKRIAEEMNRRLAHGGAVARTLHSVGFEFVRRNWSGVKLDDERKFRLARKAWAAWQRREGDRRPGYKLEDLAPDAVVGAVVKLAALGKNAAPFAQPADLVDLAVAYGIQPDNGWADEVDTDALADMAAYAMRLATEKDGTLDFDDMIFLPVFHAWTRPTYALVVVDEAQDMNVCQLELARAVARGRIVVVGDDRQAIYAFRGADAGALDRLKTELRASELPLTTTYRCPKRVVDLAAALVPDYTAAPEAPDGDVLRPSAAEMMAWATPGDFILSRTNAPLARICLALLRDGKPARIEGRDITRTLLALIRRMKADSIPDLTAKLARWAERESAKVAAMKVSDTARQARLDMIADQVATLDALSDGLAEVAELDTRIADLFADTTGPDGGKRPMVVCSTVHRAKGLEALRVFLLTDTLYCNGKRDTEEERNIHYVGLTRAKATLCLVSERG